MVTLHKTALWHVNWACTQPTHRSTVATNLALLVSHATVFVWSRNVRLRENEHCVTRQGDFLSCLPLPFDQHGIAISQKFRETPRPLSASLPRSRFLDVTRCVTSKKWLRGRLIKRQLPRSLMVPFLAKSGSYIGFINCEKMLSLLEWNLRLLLRSPLVPFIYFWNKKEAL